MQNLSDVSVIKWQCMTMKALYMVTAEVGSLPGEDGLLEKGRLEEGRLEEGSQLQSPGGGSPLEGGSQSGAGTGEGSRAGNIKSLLSPEVT